VGIKMRFIWYFMLSFFYHLVIHINQILISNYCEKPVTFP
jgi:hypothetical protein